MSFTGNLKRKDVHNAITMHPVKNHINMYRIDTYLKVIFLFLFNILFKTTYIFKYIYNYRT